MTQNSQKSPCILFLVLACLVWWACRADKAIMLAHLWAQRNINHVKPGFIFFFSFNFGNKSLQPLQNLPAAIHFALFHFPHSRSWHFFNEYGVPPPPRPFMSCLLHFIHLLSLSSVFYFDLTFLCRLSVFPFSLQRSLIDSWQTGLLANSVSVVHCRYGG